ncbi:hypothetical protein LCGC14_2333960 [marine sediment metagenome]|uniref:Uncharacterized protein n=1 Tax=marine sediment metagenome TaxID=412755 RepID=A0A0F9D1H0_9ZZZZ
MTTTCLDAVPPEQTRLKIIVRRHPVDWNDPVPATVERARAIVHENPDQAIYLNPAVTVTCPKPTEDFFREVRKRQAEWCRRASRTIPTRVRRRVSQWVGGGDPFSSKAEQYFHRAFCYTGILFINGQIVHPSQWK